MAMPNKNMVHIDQALTTISVAYMQTEDMFIADKVFPMVNVEKQSDRYFRYLKEDWFRDEAAMRAPATESTGGGYDIDNTPTYYCNKYAYHKDITEEDRVNTDQPLKPDEDAAQYVASKLLLRREVIWGSNFFIPGVWANQRVGVIAAPVLPGQFLRWDVPGSTPIEDISAAKMTIASQTGLLPNTLVLGANVYEKLRNHDDILGRIIFTQRGIVTADILAALFDVQRVVVAWAVRNIAAKGAAENTNFLLGNHALLCYVPKSPGLKTASAGYIFPWTGMMGAQSYGMRVNRFDMPILGIGTERIEGEMAFDMRIVAADLGHFFAGAVS